MSDDQRTNELAKQPEQQPSPTAPAAEEVTKKPLSEEEISARHAAWWKERQERAEALVSDSRRSWSAVQGWDAITTQADWDATMDKTAEEWHSGELFIKMLGGERYLDPPRTALMYHLWHHFIGAYRPTGPAEYLAIAMALFAFHHLIRVNEFVGNLATRTESNFFGSEPLEVRVVKDETPWGFYTEMEAKAKGHEYLAQLGREALPLMDRLNRMVIRNLRALRDLKAIPLALNVQNYGQMNVGQAQANISTLSPTQPATVKDDKSSEVLNKRRKRVKSRDLLSDD